MRAGNKKKENLIFTIVDCDGKKKKAAHVFINDARLEITNIRERGHSIDIYLREV